MPAVAEEFLASLTLLVTSLSGMLVSAIEMTVSLEPNRTNPDGRIARVTTTASLFTFGIHMGHFVSVFGKVCPSSVP